MVNTEQTLRAAGQATADEAGEIADTPRTGTDRYTGMARAALVVIFIAFAQYITPPTMAHWQYILQRAYYIPIAGAGLVLGWRAGVLTAVLAGACFSWLSSSFPGSSDLLDRLLESLIFFMVGILTGALSDRERLRRSELQDANTRLEAVHQELQNNFERMKRADRLSALGHLSAGLAHEIRNPLASIAGAASIIQNEPENARQRSEFLEIIQIECSRLNSLVMHFLDFARPRLPDFGLTDLRSVLESVSSLASHGTRNDQIQIRIEVAPGVPAIECDPEQLKQVLLNLVINAMQAMPEGGEVAVEARRAGNQVEIRVRDRGSGVAPEHLDHIFDPFFTLKETGTGLGLPVAYGILSQHGGSLQVEESSPAGTVFLVILPIKQKRQS
jgi:two-component system, NtrC family, sensor histidine kinase HydH